MKKHFIMFAAAMAVAGYTNAQVLLPSYSGDALRFSQTNYGSSARFKGMGNAQMGVGGDISSLGGNPAGLGLFTKSEFVLTPEFNGTTMSADYLGTNTKTNKSQINLNQLGAVFYMPNIKSSGQDVKKGVVSTVFGIGYSRNSDFGLETNFGGTNKVSSVYNMFDGDAAYTLGNTQDANIVRTGGVSEFNLAGAINIGNSVYIGANLGLVSVNLNSDLNFFEKGNVENYSVNYYQNQSTKGSGVNGRLGIIFRPASEFRLGVNLQTPTWFTIDDSFGVSTNNNAISATNYDFTYQLRTPMKGSFGASYVLGGKALISADVDYIDYSSILFSSANGSSQTINENNAEIKANYKGAVNYRVGAEAKLNNFVSLRAGYGVNGTAYKDDKSDDFATQFYTGGLGYRNGNYYVDLAYQRVETRSTFSPYLLNDYNEPVADAKNNKNNVFLTFGIRF